MVHDRIFQDIEAELEYAHGKWGKEFDSKNTLNDWVVYSIIYAGRAAQMSADKDTKRKNLIKAAGILISAIEWLDADQMPPRHYDPEIEKFREINKRSGGF